MQSEKDMTQGSIAKKIILFAIPVFLGNLFQQLYNMADSLIVGNFLGSNALAAVSSTGSLTFLLVGFFNGTALGAGVVIAQYFGARDYANVRKAVHTDLAFGVLCGILMTILGVAFTPQILEWMDTPPEVLRDAIWYTRVYFLGSLAIVLYNVCMGILQAVGDSKHPLYYLIFSSIVNIVLDVIFNGVLRLGVEYAALATVISQFLSVLLCMRRLLMTQDVYQVHLREIRMDAAIIRQILHVGLPSGLQNSIISISNVIIQSAINSFGSDAMAGCGAYSKLDGFTFLPITCFSMALTTFVGQNIGANRPDRVKKGARFGIICTLVMAEVIGVLMYIFVPYLIALFSDNQSAIPYGVTWARTVAPFYMLLAFSHVAAGILRGAGRSAVPMFVMLGCWCVIRIAYISIITRVMHLIGVIFVAYPITWGLSSIIFLFYLWRVDWTHGSLISKEKANA